MNRVERGKWKLVNSAIDEAEAVAGRDEEIGGAEEGRELAVGAGRAFQQPQRGGADRDDRSLPAPSTAFSASAVSATRCPVLVMHDVAVGVGAAHRQKGAGADMQRHEMRETPRASSACISRAVKCSPAVGAATAPSSRANMV